MTKWEKLETISKSNNGILKTSEVVDTGISKTLLAQFVRDNKYERVCHGIYLSPDAWRDETYLLQLQNPQIIYSHDCALYFHDLTDREPVRFTVTVKSGYNPSKLTARGVKVFTVKETLYETGVTVADTIFFNKVRVYDMERTICDILRSRSYMESQELITALKQYAMRRDKNLHKLMEYAELFHVQKIVRQYMEVLL